MKIELYDRAIPLDAEAKLKSECARIQFIFECLNELEQLEMSYVEYGATSISEEVATILADKGLESLPLTLKDGQVVKMGAYPTDEEIADYTGIHFSIEEDDGNHAEHSHCHGECCCGHEH